MPLTRRHANVALTLCALAATVVPTTAQSNGPAALLERSSMGAVHEYVPASSAIPGQTVIPSNLVVSSVYRGLLEQMLSRSATFRRQCLRIANAQQLTVRLKPVPPPWPRDVRATTRFERGSNGRLSASIDIVPLNNDVELIAHELEHVIEQLDEVDLASRADRPGTGVRSSSSTGVMFETTRALRMGIAVAQEVR